MRSLLSYKHARRGEADAIVKEDAGSMLSKHGVFVFGSNICRMSALWVDIRTALK
jgi:hypothetical protein